MFLLGAWLRLTAKRQLGRLFSHAVRITEDHELITTGIYRYIRHPAYCGTFLVLLGSSLLFGSLAGFILVLASPLGLKRICYEESLLKARFGQQFDVYAKRTKKVIPFIF